MDLVPSVSHLDPDRVRALTGVVSLVRAAVFGTEKAGEMPPAPLVDREYSGELRVRIPPAVHQRLALEAEAQSTSLNKVIISNLRAGSGRTPVQRRVEGDERHHAQHRDASQSCPPSLPRQRADRQWQAVRGPASVVGSAGVRTPGTSAGRSSIRSGHESAL